MACDHLESRSRGGFCYEKYMRIDDPEKWRYCRPYMPTTQVSLVGGPPLTRRPR